MPSVKLEQLDVTQLALREPRFYSSKKGSGRYLNLSLGNSPTVALDIDHTRAPFGVSRDDRYDSNNPTHSIALTLTDEQQASVDQMHDRVAQLLSENSQQLFKASMSIDEVKKFMLKPTTQYLKDGTAFLRVKLLKTGPTGDLVGIDVEDLDAYKNIMARVVVDASSIYFHTPDKGRILFNLRLLKMLDEKPPAIPVITYEFAD